MNRPVFVDTVSSNSLRKYIAKFIDDNKDESIYRIADRAEISDVNLRRIYKGDVEPREKTKKKILAAIGVNVQ